MNWYLEVLKKYAVFSGRARRKEYWMFVLFNMIILIIAMILDNVLGIAIEGFGYGPIYILLGLATFLPGWAVLVRRLHDVGKSGWFFFIILIPIVGAIWLLVLLCRDSMPGENQYGPNPKGTQKAIITVTGRTGITGLMIGLIICAIFVIIVIGILAAIAIPQFSAYRERVYCVAAKADLENAYTAAQAFYADNPNATNISIRELEQAGFSGVKDVNIEIISGQPKNLKISSKHSGCKETYYIDSSGKLTEQDRKKIEEKPRPKLTAYEWYAKGLEVQDTNPKEALANFKKALDIDPDYNDALIMAGFTAGNTLNLFSEGLGYLEKAERNFNGRNETKSSGYAGLMMNIGIVYYGKGQLDRALEYYLKSQSIRDGLGLQNTAGYANLMNNIGIVYKHKGQLDRALEYYLKDKSIEDGLGLQNTAGYADLMNNIGNIYNEKGRLDRALEYYLKDKSIEDGLGLQNTAGYANLMYNMAMLYEKQNRRDMAGRHFRMAYETYVKSDYSGELRDKALNNAKRLGS